jgi:hypothetical protein
MTPLIVGVDPGQTTGIALFDPDWATWDFIQCSPGSVLWIVEEGITRGARLIAIERFVVGPRSARSASAKAGQLTRDLIGALSALGEATPSNLQVKLRPAAEVKPWATDKRLLAAGTPALIGMRHAADAARHALFAAVKDCGIPDPLSNRGTR